MEELDVKGETMTPKVKHLSISNSACLILIIIDVIKATEMQGAEKQMLGKSCK